MTLSEKVQVYDDIYSTKHMGKTTDTFRRLNFRLPQTHCYNLKVILQVEYPAQSCSCKYGAF